MFHQSTSNRLVNFRNFWQSETPRIVSKNNSLISLNLKGECNFFFDPENLSGSRTRMGIHLLQLSLQEPVIIYVSQACVRILPLEFDGFSSLTGRPWQSSNENTRML